MCLVCRLGRDCPRLNTLESLQSTFPDFLIRAHGWQDRDSAIDAIARFTQASGKRNAA